MRREHVRRAHLRLRARVSGDDGFTLSEAVVGMILLMIFLTIFSGGLISMYSAANHAQAVAATSGQLGFAFDRLDTEVRYASFLSTPGQDSNDHNNWYVEMQNTNSSPATCVQLRVDQVGKQLQQRSWTDGGEAGDWITLASYVTNGAVAPGSAQPFLVYAATSTVKSAELTVNLISGQDATREGAQSTTALALTALNTSQNTPASGLCTGYRP